jgi:hypothetical protein
MLKTKKAPSEALFCDPAGIRTQDPYIKSVLLYQLSYRIEKCVGLANAFSVIACKSRTHNRIMQVVSKKNKILIAIIFFISFPCLAFSSNNQELKTADSLFLAGKYREAYLKYRLVYNMDLPENEALLLKLSFLSEKSNNYTECLYYLNKLALFQPSRAAFEKMAKIAEDHNLSGYQFDDYNYFIIFYRRYGDYVPILLLTLGAYIVAVMIVKVRRKEAILKLHKQSTIVYLLLVFGLVNIPSLYRTCIIVNDQTFLRGEPSSGSMVVERIGKGHKLTILGSVDHWNRVIWNNQIVYVRKSDTLPI